MHIIFLNILLNKNMNSGLRSLTCSLSQAMQSIGDLCWFMLQKLTLPRGFPNFWRTLHLRNKEEYTGVLKDFSFTFNQVTQNIFLRVLPWTSQFNEPCCSSKSNAMASCVSSSESLIESSRDLVNMASWTKDLTHSTRLGPAKFVCNAPCVCHLKQVL